MNKFRATTTAFTSGNSINVVIPKNIADEFGIDTKLKRTHFDIYTNENGQIIYQFTKHSEK